MTRSGSTTGSGLIRTACAMLKIAVTAPIATARINTTVAVNQPPRRTFLDADLKSVASVMGEPLREDWRAGVSRSRASLRNRRSPATGRGQRQPSIF
jgi:hypothetical protein